MLAAALATGCSDTLGPEPPAGVYALARVGPSPLPVTLGGTQTLLLADTLRLSQARARNDRQILEHVSVLRFGNAQVTRTEVQHLYSLDNGLLRYDACPLDATCISIIAAPMVFQVAGDSLFQIVPLGSSIEPYVYGRVRN